MRILVCATGLGGSSRTSGPDSISSSRSVRVLAMGSRFASLPRCQTFECTKFLWISSGVPHTKSATLRIGEAAGEMIDPGGGSVSHGDCTRAHATCTARDRYQGSLLRGRALDSENLEFPVDAARKIQAESERLTKAPATVLYLSLGLLHSEDPPEDGSIKDRAHHKGQSASIIWKHDPTAHMGVSAFTNSDRAPITDVQLPYSERKILSLPTKVVVVSVLSAVSRRSPRSSRSVWLGDTCLSSIISIQSPCSLQPRTCFRTCCLPLLLPLWFSHFSVEPYTQLSGKCHSTATRTDGTADRSSQTCSPNIPRPQNTLPFRTACKRLTSSSPLVSPRVISRVCLSQSLPPRAPCMRRTSALRAQTNRMRRLLLASPCTA